MKRTLLAVFLTVGLTGALGAQGALGATASGPPSSSPPAAVSANVLPSDPLPGQSGEASASAERVWPWRHGFAWSAPRGDRVIKPFRVSLVAKLYFLPADVFFVSAQSAARALGLDRLLSLLHKLRPNGNDLGLGAIAGLIWAVVLRSLPALIGFLCGFTRQMLWVLFRWGTPPRNRRASSST